MFASNNNKQFSDLDNWTFNIYFFLHILYIKLKVGLKHDIAVNNSHLLQP